MPYPLEYSCLLGSLVVFVLGNHEFEHEKCIQLIIEGLHVYFPENFKNVVDSSGS